MSIWIAMLLGLVQGLCEFLPISSSGHLLLLQKMFGIAEGQLFFTVMLHIGTLAAVLIVYRKMIWTLLRHPFQKTVLYLIVAIIPTVIVALLFKKVSPFDRFYEAAEQGKYLGVCFLITSALLNAAELFERPRSRRRKLQNMQLKDAVAVGCMQGVGVLPGVSRSGSTIVGALFTGLDRKAAADFSFLLSIPSIVGGAVLEIPDAIRQGVSDIPWLAVIVGMVTAGVTGYLAIRLMLAAIRKKKLWGFALYTGLLGVAVLLDQFIFHFFF